MQKSRLKNSGNLKNSRVFQIVLEKDEKQVNLYQLDFLCSNGISRSFFFWSRNRANCFALKYQGNHTTEFFDKIFEPIYSYERVIEIAKEKYFINS